MISFSQVSSVARPWRTLLWCGSILGLSLPAWAEEGPLPTDAPSVAVPAERLAGKNPSPTFAGTLEWHGSLEEDIGFARYSFDTPAYKLEDFYDFRGRFVLGPSLRFPLGTRFFLGATAQVVVWLREQQQIYQVNADDIYVRVGQGKRWDLQVGRFMTWKVYRKGLGYDLFTLEDTGAVQVPPYENNNFAVHSYEVDTIYYRETPGRAALHLYPTSWLALELVGAYGKESLSNIAGGRGAVLITQSFVSMALGAEYWFRRPASEQSTIDADGVRTLCARCGIAVKRGLGGGIVLGPIEGFEVALNGALGTHISYAFKEGTEDRSAGYTTRSVGGYAEWDFGMLLFKRGLILGTGINWTLRKYDNEKQDEHTQEAFYLALPLGLQRAMWKVVVSNSDDKLIVPDSGINKSKMFAIRTRFSFVF